tara:strand:+ start:1253 stop:1543 length:291 start_codon:yes stop_codon:yes gene_type:complete
MKPKAHICDFCHSEEGKPRPIGNYIVELKEIDVLGTNKKACQSCYLNTKRILKAQAQRSMRGSFLKKLKKFSVKLFSAYVLLLLVFSTTTISLWIC